MTVRPAEHLVHGLDGPVVVVSGRVAAWLFRHGQLADHQARHRGEDSEVDQAVLAIRIAGLAWRQRATAGTDCGTALDDDAPEPAPSPQWLATTAAAQRLGISARAVRKAIEVGHLPAERAGNRWWITTEDVEHYRRRQR